MSKIKDLQLPGRSNWFTPGKNIQKCPVCKSKVRLIFREGRYFDKYEKEPTLDLDGVEPNKVPDDLVLVTHLPMVDKETAARLHEERKGKKTVAIVGLSPSHCSLAPFEDPDVEIWGLNEAHISDWMKRWDRWFQIHDSKSWKRPVAKRQVLGHYKWLRKQTKPIYMQHKHRDIPFSKEYPLREVTKKCFGNFWRGEEHVKYFTSSMAYMMGIAILEDFERVEVYGFDMVLEHLEYKEQKANAEFFIGLAMGMGIEVYTPPNCLLMWSSLYGGDEQGAGW